MWLRLIQKQMKKPQKNKIYFNLSDWMPLCIASENGQRRGTEIFFRDERHVLQAPLHNSGKIKGSGRWLNTKPANGELGFASNTPFAGLTSSSGALTFSIELLWSRLPHIPFISFQVFLGLISIRFLLYRIRQSLRQTWKSKKPVEMGTQSIKFTLSTSFL